MYVNLKLISQVICKEYTYIQMALTKEGCCEWCRWGSIVFKVYTRNEEWVCKDCAINYYENKLSAIRAVQTDSSEDIEKSRLLQQSLQQSSQQLYTTKPVTVTEVRGLSSQTIFNFMTGSDGGRGHPLDVDDWERNRALLLCYPEWKVRLPEMAVLSPQWKALVTHWDTIESRYDEDYAKYHHNAFGKGACDQLIRHLLQSIY